MCLMCEVGLVVFIVFVIGLVVSFLPEPKREKRDGNYQYSHKERREVLCMINAAGRRTAKRAGSRMLQSHGGWMFEDDNNGKWE